MADMVETEIASVQVIPDWRAHPVVLAERAGNRELRIWVGPVEAQALLAAMGMPGGRESRAHALMAELLTVTGGRLDETRITGLENAAFVGEGVISDLAGHSYAVRARPSDLLILARLVGAPIRVAARLFEETTMSNSP